MCFILVEIEIKNAWIIVLVILLYVIIFYLEPYHQRDPIIFISLAFFLACFLLSYNFTYYISKEQDQEFNSLMLGFVFAMTLLIKLHFCKYHNMRFPEIALRIWIMVVVFVGVLIWGIHLKLSSSFVHTFWF